MTSSQVANGLRITSATLGLICAAFKAVGDIKKHHTHDTHHQLCDCVGLCYACIWANATAKGSKQSV